MGISPLSRVEIQAWEADEGVELTQWERRLILRLDGVFRASMTPNEETAKETA